MSQLLHFVKRRPDTPGPAEFVWILEGDDSAGVEADYPSYELADVVDLSEDDLGNFPTERELS